MGNNIILKIENLYKKFKHLEVIKGINLEVKEKEKVVIIGPSGGGKSTLLRCIMGLEKIEKGHIYFQNNNYISSDNRYKIEKKLQRQIGMVFQSFNLFPQLNILNNLIISPVYVHKRNKADSTNKAITLLNKIGLESKINEFPSRLSGGQCQRVAIARALMLEPKLMLFDEITSSLDIELIRDVLEVVKKLASEGMTMIVVTHEIQFAKDIADRILFIEDGKIIEENNPHDLFNEPKNPRTKSFLSHFISNSYKI